jgi:DNA modification methylase
MPDPTWRVIAGDCRSSLASLSAGSVQTCVTSPPYFGLRDYGHDGQIGLEPTPDEFVAALVDVFRSVRRVMRDDGTVWLNLGDSYNASPGQRKTTDAAGPKQLSNHGAQGAPSRSVEGCKPKDLIGVPWMVAFALRADGWYLRSDIIWSKANPMPESVTDRPTKAHEYLFLLSKSKTYYYDADAIRGDIRDWSTGGPGTGIADTSERYGAGNGGNDGLGKLAQRYKDAHGEDGRDLTATGERHAFVHPKGPNKRSVWTVATQPFPGAHFATFPPKLIEPCILAGSSPKACGVCGAPWQRVVERTAMVVRPTPKREAWQAEDDHARTQTGGTMLEPPSSRTVGWESSCEHDDDTGRSVVLDPFAGSGTVGVVCGWHGRDFIGLELSETYAEMARDRITAEGKPWRPRSEPPKVHADQLDILSALGPG